MGLEPKIVHFRARTSASVPPFRGPCVRSRRSLRPAPLTRRLTALAYSGGVRAVPASRRHEGPRGVTTGALTRLHATIVLGLGTHHAGSLRSERAGQAQWAPPTSGDDAPVPLVTVYHLVVTHTGRITLPDPYPSQGRRSDLPTRHTW